MENQLFFVVGGAALVIVLLKVLKKHTVREYEVGLKYINGRFAGALGPGAYWMLKWRGDVTTLDKRRQSLIVPSQELITADHIGIKLSLIVAYDVVDPVKASHTVADYKAELYSAAQLALRRVASEFKVEELLTVRSQLGDKLLPSV